MTQPIHMPPQMQADLHKQGVLPDPDYYFNKDGQVQANADKLRRYIKEHGEPWF